MASLRLHHRRDESPALHERATSDLAFIRATLERSGSFTAVPGYGGMWLGATALAATALARAQSSDLAWLLVWLGEALVAGGLMVYALDRKARRAGSSLAAGPGARFLRCMVPPILAGALLTWVLFRSGRVYDLPGTWLLMYGVTVLTAGAFSIPIVRIIGISFFLLAPAAFFTNAALRDLWLALGFGGFHLVFGWIIARRHGG